MNTTQKSIIYSIVGFFLFAITDAVVKIVLVDHTPFEVQLWISTSALIFLFMCAKPLGGLRSLKHITRPHIHLLKATLVTATIMSNTFALQWLSLDVFYALIFTAPMMTSLLAAIFFKEHLAPAKIILLLFGFSGVLLVTRPGSGIDPVGVALVLFSASAFATNCLLNKLFKPNEAKLPFGLFPHLLMLVLMLSLNGGTYAPMDTANISLCILIGACSILGLIALVHAFQIAKAAVAAPYHYTQLIWGVIFGYVFFGDMPDIWVTMGAFVIIASGLAIYIYDTRKVVTA